MSNPKTANGGVHSYPGPTLPYLTFDAEQARENWHPTGYNEHWKIAVAGKVRREILSDQQQYPEGRSHRGVSLLRGYEAVFSRQHAPTEGILVLAGTRFTDPTGVYAKFFEAMYRVLLREIVALIGFAGVRRLLITTGGGPGFGMTDTCLMFRRICAELGIDERFADVLQVLARVPLEMEPVEHAARGDLLVRQQGKLAERFDALIIPASAALCVPFGLGGKDEEGQLNLMNQLVGLKGPIYIGPRLCVLLDCQNQAVMTRERCKQFRIAPHGSFFDWWELQRRTFLAYGTAAPNDWRLYLRVRVDKDPEKAGAELGRQLLKWFEIRASSGLRDVEAEAVRAALETF